MSMLMFDEAAVRRLLPISTAIELLQTAFAGLAADEAVNQPRRRLFASTGTVLHSMAGAVGPYLGTKVYSTNPKHGAWFLFWLLDAVTGRPLAIFEANVLGQIRTGAASGLATKLLSRQNSTKVAIIGSGFQASSQLQATMAVRQITEVRVWSRNREKCEKFAQKFPMTTIANSAEDAVHGADIVITATSSKDPVFDAAALSPGTHINVMGSNSAVRREVSAEVLARANRIVADSLETCRIEAGDLLLGLDNQGWSRVEELCRAQPRSNDMEITLFKSVGMGLEDVAVAGYIYEQAKAIDDFPSVALFD